MAEQPNSEALPTRQELEAETDRIVAELTGSPQEEAPAAEMYPELGDTITNGEFQNIVGAVAREEVIDLRSGTNSPVTFDGRESHGLGDIADLANRVEEPSPRTQEIQTALTDVIEGKITPEAFQARIEALTADTVASAAPSANQQFAGLVDPANFSTFEWEDKGPTSEALANGAGSSSKSVPTELPASEVRTV